jgi:hypothetical protein
MKAIIVYCKMTEDSNFTWNSNSQTKIISLDIILTWYSIISIILELSNQEMNQEGVSCINLSPTLYVTY